MAKKKRKNANPLDTLVKRFAKLREGYEKTSKKFLESFLRYDIKKLNFKTIKDAIKASKRQKVLYDAHVKSGDFLQELQDFKASSGVITGTDGTTLTVDAYTSFTDTHKAQLYSLLMSFYKKGISHGVSSKNRVEIKRKKKRK